MSAREELYAALMAGGPHSPERSEKASARIDTFAHQLAERQRAEHDASNYHMGQPCKEKFRCTVRDLINQIDPEVPS